MAGFLNMYLLQPDSLNLEMKMYENNKVSNMRFSIIFKMAGQFFEACDPQDPFFEKRKITILDTHAREECAYQMSGLYRFPFGQWSRR